MSNTPSSPSLTNLIPQATQQTTDFPSYLRSTIRDSDWEQIVNFLRENEITTLGELASIINLKDEDAQSDSFQSIFSNLSIVGRGKLWNAIRKQRYKEKIEPRKKRNIDLVDYEEAPKDDQKKLEEHLRKKPATTTSMYHKIFEENLVSKISFEWNPDYKVIEKKIVFDQPYPPHNIPQDEPNAVKVCWHFLKTIAKQLGFVLRGDKRSHRNDGRFVDLLLFDEGTYDDDKTIQNSLSAIEFKRLDTLRVCRSNTISNERNSFSYDATVGFGQLINYGTYFGSSVNCALCDFETIVFVRVSKEKIFISDRYSLCYKDGIFSDGFELLFRMWGNIHILSSFRLYGTPFPPTIITLKDSSNSYVLTHLLCDKKFTVFRAYSLSSLKIVVIKLGNGFNKTSLSVEARNLSRLLGVNGVQQLVEYSSVLPDDYYDALVTTPFGIPLLEIYPEPLTKMRTTELILELESIIQNIHSHNIVHSDIKPSNIIMVDSHPFIIDFESARDIGCTTGYSGTPEYAPVGFCITVNTSYDYESLVYVAIQLTSKLLPWSRDDSDMDKRKRLEVRRRISSFPIIFRNWVKKNTNLLN